MKSRFKILTIVISAIMLLTACGNEPIEEVQVGDSVIETPTTDMAKEDKPNSEASKETENAKIEEVIMEISDPIWIGAPKENDYVVEQIEPITMYANSSLNVRIGPGAEYERYAALNLEQEVIVTGIAENGWYEIEHNGTIGYVNPNYISEDKTKVILTEDTDESKLPLPIPEPIVLPECEHYWKNGKVLQYATCSTSGLIEQKCTSCGIINIGTIKPKDRHDFELVEEGDCLTYDKHQCIYCGEWFYGEYGEHVDNDKDRYCDICCMATR